MVDVLEKRLYGTVLFIILAVLNLLLAFPLMWTWNYVIPYLFHLPDLTWSRAWCLMFVAGIIIKSDLITQGTKRHEAN